MSTFVPKNQEVLPQAIADISTTQLMPLGTRCKAYDVASTNYGEGEFIYLLGVASTAIGSAVVINPDDFSTTLASANAIGSVAFAMSANVASSYGWYQIYGKAVGKVLTGFADNANCYLTSTAGSIDDAIVAGDYISGCKGASAINTPSTGLAELEISYPFVQDGLNV